MSADRLCIALMDICSACKGIKTAIRAFAQAKWNVKIQTKAVHQQNLAKRNTEKSGIQYHVSDKTGAEISTVIFHSGHQAVIGKTVHGLSGPNDQMIQQGDVHKRTEQIQGASQLLILP